MAPIKLGTYRAKSILTPQTSGFLASSPYPFTHTLSPYLGCSFGITTCGMYCYAQFLTNWQTARQGVAWGEAVIAKENAAPLLQTTLERLAVEKRSELRIFMASSTDPYQGLEKSLRISRQCLEAFAQYPELDLLVIQTRSRLAMRDFDLMRRIPYLWLSVTVETDDPRVFARLKGGPRPEARIELVRRASAAGIPAQITVSPCLPYTEAFVQSLVGSGARRIVIDTFVDGDGTNGKRTQHSAYANAAADWRDTSHAYQLHTRLQEAGMQVGWSAAGFCGIPPRSDGEHWGEAPR